MKNKLASLAMLSSLLMMPSTVFITNETRVREIPKTPENFEFKPELKSKAWHKKRNSALKRKKK